VIQEQELDSEDDAVRDESEVMATVYGEAITWGEIKGILTKPVNAASLDKRHEALNELIDYRIMARKGREAGLERDPLYLKRYNEFRKTRLINMHRTNLVHRMNPSDEEIWAYYDKHRDTLVVPARRKVQIVVLKSKEDAEAVKQMVEAGTITMYQAAKEYSILAGADKTLGELGWVSEGTGFPELDELTFSLGPGKIGGPVETPNGWHLVKVQDVEDAKYDDLEDPQTLRMVRRKLLKEKLNDYVVSLREKEFAVEVYDKKLSYHTQKELDWYHIKHEKGVQPPEKILEDIGKLRGEPVH
jgi:parvulin-like peptidyl-prolyl isomerase